MRILTAYITRDFIVTFLVSLMIFLFVMAVGNIFRVIDLFSRGVSGILILQVFSCGIPFTLIFAIPMSVLAASFLQFSRMASDREIVAMKACGISIWEIVQPPIIIATVLCVLCIYINCSLAPGSHYARRKVLGRLGVETPMSLLDEGRFVRDFPGLTIYVGSKYGRRLSDIVIHQFGDKGLKQTIQAESGTIDVDKDDQGKILINLYRVEIDQADENQPDNLSLSRHMSADEYPLHIDVAKLVERGHVWKKRADLTMTEVFNGIRGIPAFSSGDFIDLDGLAQKLRQPEDPVSAYFRSLFSEKTRRLLAVYDNAQPQRKALSGALVSEFNMLIRCPR
ncbi:LptF/LptG family permease, partial [Verrucomicrobiota bacterium]